MSVVRRVALIATAVMPLLSGVGCFVHTGPTLGPFSLPIPVSPYQQKKFEDKFWDEERYGRAPILDALPEGGIGAIDPPSDDEVMRALEKARGVQGGVPFLHEKQRNNVRIVKEKIGDYVDPPRVYPLIGPAQLHHAHYKCTVYYEQIERVGWPVPHTLHDEDTREVVYIDHDHLHLVGSTTDLVCEQ